jgi:hypothetical protein
MQRLDWYGPLGHETNDTTTGCVQSLSANTEKVPKGNLRQGPQKMSRMYIPICFFFIHSLGFRSQRSNADAQRLERETEQALRRGLPRFSCLELTIRRWFLHQIMSSYFRSDKASVEDHAGRRIYSNGCTQAWRQLKVLGSTSPIGLNTLTNQIAC